MESRLSLSSSSVSRTINSGGDLDSTEALLERTIGDDELPLTDFMYEVSMISSKNKK